MKVNEKITLVSLFLVFAGALSYSQDSVKLTYSGGENYTLVERTDLRRYDNNRYIGLLSREVRSCISCNDDIYEGSFYVDEKTQHQARSVAAGIHNAIPSTFRITEDGQLIMIEDCGYPSFRSFPAFTREPVSKGQSWTSIAERSVDPLNKGLPTKFAMQVLYTYLKDDFFHGEDVYVLSAEWATRYGPSNIDENGDPDLKSASGKHKATMYISKETGYALVVRDYCEETFIYADRNNYTFKGTISLFTEYAPAMDANQVLPAIQRATVAMPDSISVEKTAAGLRMIMKNLQFKANSAELLPGEEVRLNQIAEILKQAPSNQFLVEGHTASTGQPNAELKLSVQRANTIAMELSKRGIAADRFICQGRGSSRPIADNSTPEGKAANRRVEITIFAR